MIRSQSRTQEPSDRQVSKFNSIHATNARVYKVQESNANDVLVHVVITLQRRAAVGKTTFVRTEADDVSSKRR